MTLLDSLPKKTGFNNDLVEQIEIPIGAKQDEKEVPGYVDPAWLKTTFADFVNKEVPLSENDYQALLDASTDMWKLNWQEFRKQGII